ncbi:MAG: right-handed parallel beta-helix repeat-containing protein [bacterium]
MNRFKLYQRAILCSLMLTLPLWGTIIYVPSQYPTIQQGLNAAQYGDTVLVASGTYPENIIWPSQDGIFLMSESGPAVTAINGSSIGRVLNFPNYSFTQNTVITGFTVENGTAEKGAGIYLYDSPYIVGNIIQRNIAQGTSTWVHGGGIFCDGTGTPRIEANTFIGNVTRGEYWNHGAGIYVDDNVSPLIIGNTFESDSAIGGYWNYGAGIYCDQGSYPDIRHNIIHSNVATGGDRGYGVGIHAYGDCPAYILSNLLYNNTAQSGTWNYGAGIHINSMAIVYNNTIAGNSCIGGGSNRGGGIHVYDSTNTIANNIVVNNSAVNGGGIGGPSNAHATLMNNDVWNNTGGNYYNITPGPNDISEDPLFATGPLGDYYLSQTAAGQPQNSPCVDYGFTTAESLELHTFTTRTDTIYDSDTVDLGYHYPTQLWVSIDEHWNMSTNGCFYTLLQANPTLSRTGFKISLSISQTMDITLDVFDRLGRFIKKLHHGSIKCGYNEWIWSGHDEHGHRVPSGVYFILAKAGSSKVLSKKVILLE